jgi:hypothetical protein
VTGRNEVRRLQRKLDAAFDRARQVTDDEVRSDLARHLCILVSGWFEKSVAELLLNFSRSSPKPVVTYVENSLRWLTNVRKDRLLDTLGAFDARWRDEFDRFVVDEYEAALNSVVALRNDIAHGGAASISFATISAYYGRIEEIVDRLSDRLDPPPRV